MSLGLWIASTGLLRSQAARAKLRESPRETEGLGVQRRRERHRETTFLARFRDGAGLPQSSLCPLFDSCRVIPCAALPFTLEASPPRRLSACAALLSNREASPAGRLSV